MKRPWILIPTTFWLVGATLSAAQEPSPKKAKAATEKPALKSVLLPSSVVLEPNLEYGSAGERPLKLDLLRPKSQGDKALPVIVAIHGGGWQGGSKEQARGMLVGYVASGRYIGVSVGYRLTGEAIWPAQIHDCKAAIRWVRANASKYHLDPDRIGVVGNSAGGHLAALLGTSGDVKELEGTNGNPGVSSRVRCVADYCGPSNFPTFLSEPGAGGRGAVIKLFGGEPSEKKEAAKDASPVSWVSKDDPPFLIFHGTKDATVPFAQAEALDAALRASGVTTIFVRVENAGHGDLRGPEINQLQRKFFGSYLLGESNELSDAPIRFDPAKK